MTASYSDSWTTVYATDALSGAKLLEPESIHTIICSPPYWGLRSYLDKDHPDKERELGTEPTPEAYVEKLVEIFRALRDVLRDDGTLFANLGTTYINQSIESEECVLRDDLSPAERAYVLQELAKHV